MKTAGDKVEVQRLSLDKLKLKESKYLFLQVTDWDPEDIRLRTLANSIKELGILQPILIQRLGGRLHLVDGFKRAVLARALNIEELPCRFLDHDISTKEILELLLVEHHKRVCFSLTSRICFVNFALRLGMDRDTLLQHFFPLIELKGHEAVLRKIEAIAKLPQIVLDFCDEKKFSMRQCVHLTRYPMDLLLQVFSWKGELYLTASIAEEILSNLKDHLRGTGQGMSDLLKDKEVKNLFASSLSPHEKTKQLQTLIKKRHFPILTDTNLRLEHIKKQMSLPRGVDIAWDPTLEKKELKLLFKIHEPEDWESILQALKVKEVKHGIAELLEIL